MCTAAARTKHRIANPKWAAPGLIFKGRRRFSADRSKGGALAPTRKLRGCVRLATLEPLWTTDEVRFDIQLKNDCGRTSTR